jgi:hypothetical protein
MRFYKSALCATVAAGLLAGCGANLSSSTGSVPSLGAQAGSVSYRANVFNLPPTRGVQVLHAILQPDKKKKPSGGIYVSEFEASDIYGYAADNKANKPPTCSVSGVEDVNGVAVDGKGNLMDPDGGSSYLMLFKGPGMCGKSLGLISDTYGQPSDASSADAATGKIALANIFDTGQSPGSVSVCTLKGGCTTNLTNTDIDEAGGVAMASDGDCWISASGESSGGADPHLVYFKGCAGKGQAATGFKNSSYGGLDIDAKGNLVSVDVNAEKLYIYSGCTPACKVVGGPFALHGTSFFGKVNSTSTEYAAADLTNGSVDVYSYSTSKVSYEYSFTNGLTASADVIGIAFNPRSKE